MDPIPEFLKDFIVAYSTELFSGLLILAGVGAWSVARRLRRAAAPTALSYRFPAEGIGRLDADPLLGINESLDLLDDRVARLEVFTDFDRQLGRRSDR